MQGVLYFPYIEVPSSTWFTRTLLYWDHVGTIMPMGEMMRPERWSGYTNALVRAELLRLVDPREGHIGMLDATFGAYLASLSDEELASRRESCELDEIEPIFKAKMPEDAVFFNLLDLGLAKTTFDDWDDGTIWVERRTAAEFMASLVLTLCSPGQSWQSTSDGQPMGWIPTTDTSLAAQALVQGASRDQAQPLFLRVAGHQRTEDVRVDVLDRLLPVPADPIPVAELVRFREKYGDLLPRLRRLLEAHVDSAVQIDDPAMRQRYVDRIADELEERVQQARAYMNESLQRRISSSRLLRWSKALPVMGRAADTVRDVADSLVTQPDIRMEPLAYLAFAHAEFGPAVPTFKVDPWTGTPIGEAYPTGHLSAAPDGPTPS